MAKLRVFFLIDLNISLLIRDQEDSHHRGLMSKSSISLKYWPSAPLFKSSEAVWPRVAS